MIVTALARTVTERQTLVKLVATVQRLAQRQQIAFAGKLYTELLAHRARTAVAANQIRAADFLATAVGGPYARRNTVAILPQ